MRNSAIANCPKAFIRAGFIMFAVLLWNDITTTAQPKPTSRRLLTSPQPIAIQWRNNLPDDFSFSKGWEYPEGIERKPNGRPGCADGGFCPPRAEAMQDEKGNVPEDSLALYYSLVDTTHRRYSIQAAAWCYEYAGTHYLQAHHTDTGTVSCATEMNTATHCSLMLLLKGDTCKAVISLNSIAASGNRDEFYCDGGSIRIDRKAWDKHLLKATFSFTFQNREHPTRPIFWRGRIYSPIEQNPE